MIKGKIVVLLLAIVVLSCLYLNFYKIRENYEDSYSVTTDPSLYYTAANNQPISCNDFCRKVGLTDLNKNCSSFNGDIHMRCLNKSGILVLPNCLVNNLKEKCVPVIF